MVTTVMSTQTTLLLEALLSTPHPSGKLARWGMAIQEVNLTIYHRAGKHNSNADVLSRASVPADSKSRRHVWYHWPHKQGGPCTPSGLTV